MLQGLTAVVPVITIGSMQSTPAREALAEYMSAEKGRTQVWLAKTLGVSQSTVSLWARGNSRPPLANALAIQFLTGIPVDMWLTEEERRLVASVSVEAHRVMEERAKERTHRRAVAGLDPRQVPIAFEQGSQEPPAQDEETISGVMEVSSSAALTLLSSAVEGA